MLSVTKFFLFILLPCNFIIAQQSEKGFDIIHYKLNLDLYNCFISPFPQSFKGFAEIKIKADKEINNIVLDASSYSIKIDSTSGNIQSFNHSDDKLSLTFRNSMSANDSIRFTVYYTHKNVRDGAFLSDNRMVFTNNAPEGARNWFPCYDHPSDKATFELIAKTPANVLLGSNGSLIDSTLTADTVYYHWKSRDPVATYLIVISAKVDYNLDIVGWINPESNEIIPTRFYWQDGENIENLNNIKSINTPMMDFFSELFSPYPFEKNGYATLNEHFVYGGMENQTLTSLCSDCWNEILVVHEFTHAWFGNLITHKNWSDVWLNESFANYGEALWIVHTKGKAEYKKYIKIEAERYFRENPGFPVYNSWWNDETPPSNILYNGAIIYSKGACVLSMFRNVVGDSLFFAVLKSYTNDERFRFGNADTDDFISVVNKITGKDYTKYFNQWLKTADHPVYQNYFVITEDENEFRIDLTINQVQDNETAYEMPVTLQIIFSDGTNKILKILNSKRAENYFFKFEKEPLKLIFDPFNEIVLKEDENIKVDAIEITY
ncbi:MAG TPA: M1 family metallopeptidase [Ignavibacteriaceae bacterium]|nr:M1 family metallopeptidase [Ignavibacteriaceae bacterium]